MKIRKGMWVVHEGEVGIVSAVDSVAAEVHYVNEAGATIGRQVVGAASLRQARLEEIPEPRRPEPARGALLGYD